MILKSNCILNKNDNIHKNEVQESDKYRVAVNITEYHIISKLIFLRIIIPKSMKLRQLFKNVCNNVKINMFNMDAGTFLVTIIELLRSLH